MHSAYSEASWVPDHVRQFKPRTFLLGHCSGSGVNPPPQHLSSLTHCVDPFCKERMWGGREKPLCKQPPGQLWMWCGLPTDPEHRPDMCEGPWGPSLHRERGHRLVAAGEHLLGRCLCSCVLSLTQSVTVHPLTTHTKVKAACPNETAVKYYKYTSAMSRPGLCSHCRPLTDTEKVHWRKELNMHRSHTADPQSAHEDQCQHRYLSSILDQASWIQILGYTVMCASMSDFVPHI